MKIFYSWQSDLALKDNKNLIESCIQSAITEFNSENKHLVDFTIDKDTTGEPGNPEIVNVILSRIDSSKLFICDLSIINNEYFGRKTANPNVIFELGYAIKSLGWERIICIVNRKFGLPEELPFDIKHRRNLIYDSSNKDRKIQKRKIIDAIKLNINVLNARGMLHDELEDYFKRDIDTEFLTICNHLQKIIFDNKQNNLLDLIKQLLNLSKAQLTKHIEDRKILGFHVFKTFKINVANVKKLIDNNIAVSNFKKERITTLVKFKDWLDWYNKFNDGRNFKNLFDKFEIDLTYQIVSGNNKELPDRYILGKNLPENRILVDDFGDITLKSKIEDSVYYHKINKDHLENYSKLLFTFIEITTERLDRTGGEFIVDTFNQFEMK